MEFVADLHLHSKYSRAVSPQMNLQEMDRWAQKKGIDLLTTGDFTHPLWLRSIKAELQEVGKGIYEIKSSTAGVVSGGERKKLNLKNDTRFILTTEIASIFKQGGKLRRIHNLVFAPNIETVDKITKELLTRGCNLGSDGRPIIGLSSKNLLEMLLNIDKSIILIPCHAWTPHFGIYGSASGFDSIKESFEELSSYIYGVETGISSDPWMNWQIEELKNRSILSFSDAHSLPKMGREATVFSIEKDLKTLEYVDIGKAIISQMKTGDKKWREKNSAGIAYTIEFYPEEGRYHYAGHRNCKVVKSPLEINKSGDICPVCKRKLTEGVMYRVQQLAGNSDFKTCLQEPDENGIGWIKDPENIHPPFVKLVPLNEIIAESIKSPVGSEKVKAKFDELCLKFGSEINILLRTSIRDLTKNTEEKIAEGIAKVRKGDIMIEPGFDGEYGKVKIWSEEETAGIQVADQKTQLDLKF